MDDTSDLIESRERLTQLVADSVPALESKRSYARAVGNFLDWFQKERPTTGFSRATVQRYRTVLIDSRLSSSTVTLNLTAIRRLAAEAADNGFITSEVAAGIARIRGVRRNGLRIGKWLTIQEAEKLMDSPDVSTLKGKRDKALLAVLVGCGLRREEAARLSFQHVQEREGRWVIVDMLGKGKRIRTVPMPLFAKAAIDDWIQAAGFTSGHLFRPLNKAGKISGESMSGQAVFEIVKQHTAKIGLSHTTPHHLRKTFARLAHNGKSSLEQVQLSLGHGSVATTEKYVGVQQDLKDAPCDHLGLRVSSSTS